MEGTDFLATPEQMMEQTAIASAMDSERQDLTALFAAESVAIVGASSDETKLSGLPLRNLRRCGFGGRIHAVNRRGTVIGGVQTHATISAIDDRVDAAIIMVPAENCAAAVTELASIGVRVAIVAVSGFAELGTSEGRRRQQQLIDAAREAGIRLVGPNCNGIYDTHRRLSLGYNHLHGRRLTPGGVALLSHSGAIAGTALELLEPFGAGFSHFVSCGNEADLSILDYAEFLLDDPHVAVFALLIDSVDDGPRFRRFARRARERGRPVIVMKLGDSDVGRGATLAHSSRLSGSRAVYEAVFDADGVILVPTLEALLLTAGLVSQGRTSTRAGVLVASPSGGAGIAMADALDRAGVQLAPLDDGTSQALASTARFATVMNPFDLGASGGHNAKRNLSLLARADGVGVLNLVVTILQTQLGQRRYAEALASAAAEIPDLAVLATASAPLRPLEADILRTAGIPVVSSTSETAHVVAALRGLACARRRELPALSTPPRPATTAKDSPPMRALRGSTVPDEAEAKQLLGAYGIPHPAERVVTFDEVDDVAATLPYPVVVKGLARGLAHKTERGLVVVDVRDEDELAAAAATIRRRLTDIDDAAFLIADLAPEGCEVIVGLVRDPEFGLLAVLGPGGTAVELIGELHHVALPTSRTEIRRVLERGVLGRLLGAQRGKPAADREALVELVMRLADAAPTLEPYIEAVELNPVRVGRGDGAGAFALDALIVPRGVNPATTEAA